MCSFTDFHSEGNCEILGFKAPGMISGLPCVSVLLFFKIHSSS